MVEYFAESHRVSARPGLHREMHTARERPARDASRIKIQTISKEGDLLPRLTQVTPRQIVPNVKRAITQHRIRIDRKPSTLRGHGVARSKIALSQHHVRRR